MLEFNVPLIEGRLISRYQRFFADVRLLDGRMVTAHCANTGRMTGLLTPDARVWIRTQPPGRKLAYAWELVETPLGLACVNTARANPLVAGTALQRWLPGTTFVRREPRVGTHRFDLELRRDDRPVYVEIKSVTLCDNGIGLFPDAPSERAVQHLHLLAGLAAGGVEAHVVLVGMHAGIQSVQPATQIDPRFTQACLLAQEAGVGFTALSVQISQRELSIKEPIPWML
jgi:sugar fermentation stimulation protein A